MAVKPSHQSDGIKNMHNRSLLLCFRSLGESSTNRDLLHICLSRCQGLLHHGLADDLSACLSICHGHHLGKFSSTLRMAVSTYESNGSSHSMSSR
jgi:hypothetical protein